MNTKKYEFKHVFGVLFLSLLIILSLFCVRSYASDISISGNSSNGYVNSMVADPFLSGNGALGEYEPNPSMVSFNESFDPQTTYYTGLVFSNSNSYGGFLITLDESKLINNDSEKMWLRIGTQLDFGNGSTSDKEITGNVVEAKNFAGLISLENDSDIYIIIGPKYDSDGTGGINYMDAFESEKCDVIIDFSNFKAVPALLSFAVSRKIPVVVCTTGLDAETKRQLVESASTVPVFHSANMSMGIALMRVLAAKAAAVLGDSFDIEIVERHHNRKIDAPSGTAIMLADAIDTVWDGRYDYVFDRHSRTEKRSKYEIGISSVRGGNIVGDHEVIFAGENEVIELTHRAQSREVFAEGAIKAAVFLADKDRGIYTMDDLVGGF